MTPAEVAPRFEREYGYTEADWLRCLPGAAPQAHWAQPAAASALFSEPALRLRLSWTVLPPRQIALLRMPRLAVVFDFEEGEPAERWRFLRFFDLYMQRGGG